jgi:hypothetical protein
MSDYQMDAEPGDYRVTGAPIGLEVMRGAESWQFFAFVFAAVLTLALTVLDEVPDDQWPLWFRIATKVLAFFGLGYVTLRNNRVRRWLLSTLLPAFKRERG